MEYGSRPTGARGLKCQLIDKIVDGFTRVASHRGAWIEMFVMIRIGTFGIVVASHRGAWIEIQKSCKLFVSHVHCRVPQGRVD